jgi:radical SAM protein with 4Fe4S-binding SPASM domain
MSDLRNEPLVSIKNLASGKVSLKRFLNRFILFCSRKMGSTYVPPLPCELIVESTNACNLSCPLCPTGASVMTRPKEMMKEETFNRIMEDASSTLLHLYLSHYGEPFLHPKIFQWIKQAKKRRIPRVMLNTNCIPLGNPDLAQKVIDSGLDEVVISLDGATPETYVQYRRGGDFSSAVRGIKNLVEARKRRMKNRPVMDLQFIVMKHNESEIGKMEALARDLGVDRVTFKNCGIDLKVEKFRKQMNEFLPVNHQNYIVTKLQDTSGTPPPCEWIWKTGVVLANGDVVPCCADWDGQFVMGNINQRKLKKIWRCSKFTRFRHQVATRRNSLEICRGCPEGYGPGFYEGIELR